MQPSEYKNIFLNEETHFYYRSTHDTVLRLIEKNLPSKKPLKILDAGCGTGFFMSKLKKFGVVFGVDINPEAVKFAKKRGVKNITLSSVEKLPFKDNFFDILVSVDVLYHQEVGSDVKALEEFCRVLKPGGIVVLKVPAFNWLRGHHDIVVKTRRRYTKNELAQKLKKAGLEIKRLSYGNMAIFPVALLKRVTDGLKKNHSSDIDTVSPLINKTLMKIMKVENKILTSTGLPFGLSVFAVAQKSEGTYNKRVPV